MNNRRVVMDKPTIAQLKTELNREKYRSRFGSVLWNTIFILIVVAAVTVLVAVLWLPILEIYGTSMAPTLEEGEIVMAVNIQKFERGDVVAFYYGNKLLVKRVIGLPGERVNITEDGVIYVNGVALKEPYIRELSLGDCDVELPIEVPFEKYFVVGDNRKTSLDSRSTSVGCVGEDQIAGKVIMRVWPLNKLSVVK